MRDAPIASDDPLAAQKLTDRIAHLKALQAQMTAANKIVRKFKGPTVAAMEALNALGLSEQVAHSLFTADYGGRLGFPGYELQNNGQNIKRLEIRLAGIMERANDETREEQANGCTITDNVEAHRVQIEFPGKPSERVRSFLKSCGFRWAPSVGLWQTHRSERALWRAREAVKLVEPDSHATGEPKNWESIEAGGEVASNEASVPLMTACASTPTLG